MTIRELRKRAASLRTFRENQSKISDVKYEQVRQLRALLHAVSDESSKKKVQDLLWLDPEKLLLEYGDWLPSPFRAPSPMDVPEEVDRSKIQLLSSAPLVCVDEIEHVLRSGVDQDPPEGEVDAWIEARTVELNWAEGAARKESYEKLLREERQIWKLMVLVRWFVGIESTPELLAATQIESLSVLYDMYEKEKQIGFGDGRSV